jgi:hypothetical protein
VPGLLVDGRTLTGRVAINNTPDSSNQVILNRNWTNADHHLLGNHFLNAVVTQDTTGTGASYISANTLNLTGSGAI